MPEGYQQLTDATIIMREKDSYKQLYLLHYKKLYNYGRKFTVDISLIEDSIQDVFLDYWKRGESVVQAAALTGYLFSAFRYSLFQKIGRAKKTVAWEQSSEDPDFSADHFIIEEEATQEMRQKIQEALLQLTGKQREALFLRFYEGLSYEAIATIMGITTKASYKLMARSLLQLKSTLSLTAWLLLWQSLLAQQKII